MSKDSNDFYLFHKETLTFREKFFILIDLLLSNQNPSRIESVILLGIYHIQIISGFFSEQIGVFRKDKFTSDKIFYYLQKISRFKDILINKYSDYKICIMLISFVLVIFLIHFFLVCSKIKNNSFYSYNEIIINYFIKLFDYVCFNTILDLFFLNFCFGNDNDNPFFENISCKLNDNLGIKIISIFLFILSVFIDFIIHFFYCEGIYLSTSFYSRINCNYEIFLCLNSICYSFLLIQIKFTSKEIFLIYNLIISTLLFKFYLTHYLFYDKITNNLVGVFHILYLWTSFFTFLFKYIKCKEIGIIYLISSILIIFIFFNIKVKMEEKIFLETPFYKITNKNYFLFYIKNLMDKINHIKENSLDKALLSGIIQMHLIECPNNDCISKTNNKLYLPITNEWSDRTKPTVEDKVYLFNFIIIIMNYLISQKYFSPDMVINLSIYYIYIIGNYCQAIYYYKLVKEMNLTLQERTSFERLKIKISKILIEKCKPPGEICSSLEDLNVSLYFKYEELSQNFINEIDKDVKLSLDFWKILRNAKLDSNYRIDFNKIFYITDQIRAIKKQVEKIWNILLSIYQGVNDLFNLYSQYVEQINDDDLKIRNLENLRKKNENNLENFSHNYYSILFNKRAGIIIANGDEGKEGLIEKTNSEVENIFKYKSNELKGMNLSSLMPKNFSNLHNFFMKKYYNVGEKIVIDKNYLTTYAIDKDNSIIMLKIAIKLFPILNDNVYFIGIFSKENIDDIIYIDNNFEIQGMSTKLMKILNINNKLLFQDKDIPFYVICRKFVNFYKIFLQGKKQNIKEKKKEKRHSQLIDSNISEITLFDDSFFQNNNEKSNKELNDNIEINENIELEYEICFPQFLIDFLESLNNKNKTTLRENTIENNNDKEYKEIESENFIDDYTFLVNNKEDINDNQKSLISINQLIKKKNSFIQNTKLNEDNNNKNDNDKNKHSINSISNSIIINTPFNSTPPQENQKNEPYKIIINRIGEGVVNNNNLNENQPMNHSEIQFENESDEEKEFNIKIQLYKELFNSGEYDKLENLIDSCNSTSNEYKFNFTFDIYKFGNKNISYVIRCIDNKNIYSNSEGDSLEILEPKAKQYKKEKIETIKPLFEIIEEEKEKLLNQTKNFFNLSIENQSFQNLLNLCREDINKTSLVYGIKKDEIQVNENSSQASQSGFNSDLVKKNRIEEIRANILNNISSFYILKYIKILVFFILIFTIIYSIIYLILFLKICDDLNIDNKLNIKLFQTTIWTTNLIGTLVSIRALFFSNQKNQNFNYNSFIEDKNKFFLNMRKYSYIWYNNITFRFGELEYQIRNYLSKEILNKYFWNEEKINYYYKHLNYDTETFPVELSLIMSNVNSLIMNPSFNLISYYEMENIEKYFKYVSFSVIENAYDNLIPNQYNKILVIPKFFQDYNGSSRRILIIFLCIYSGIMGIFCILYFILLHLINKNMSEEFETITKIKLENIEETIQKIKGFNLTLKQFKDNDQKMNEIDIKDNTNIEGTKFQNTSFQNINEINNQTNTFTSDTKKFIPLRVLSFSYFQIIIVFSVLCSFLIPIYLITNTMVLSTNKLINVENYIFGKILKAGASILAIKCKMNECDVKKQLNYSIILKQYQKEDIVQGINTFKDLKIFYYEHYLLNACKSAFDIRSMEFEKCSNDKIIKSANNTESLLKIIEDYIDSLEREIIINENNVNYSLSNGIIVSFSNIYIFELDYFKNLEKIFYKYIVPVSDNFASICISSLSSYLKYKRNIVILLTILFCVMVIFLCLYISFYFVKKLIRLLRVSRSILKIIPVFVINNTQELEILIENKY